MNKSVLVVLSAILLGTSSCSTVKTARYMSDYSDLAEYKHVALSNFMPRNNVMDSLVLNIKQTMATYFKEVSHDSLDILADSGVKIISPRVGSASAREKKGNTTVKIQFLDYTDGKQVAEMTIVANGKEVSKEHDRVLEVLNEMLLKIRQKNMYE